MRFTANLVAASVILGTTGGYAGEVPPAMSAGAAAKTRAAPFTADDINLAIQRAIEFISSRQEVDGRWISPEFETECPNCLTALAAYTLHTAGVPLSNYRLQRRSKSCGIERALTPFPPARLR